MEILSLVLAAESLHATRPDLAAMPEPDPAELDGYEPPNREGDHTTRTTQTLEAIR